MCVWVRERDRESERARERGRAARRSTSTARAALPTPPVLYSLNPNAHYYLRDPVVQYIPLECTPVGSRRSHCRCNEMHTERECVCVCLCVCVCTCACVRERVCERERQKARKRERVNGGCQPTQRATQEFKVQICCLILGTPSCPHGICLPYGLVT